MAETLHVVTHVPDRSYQAIARAELKAIANRIGFAGSRLGEVEIIIAELTSNLVKHAKEGKILCRILEEKDNKGLELISIDHGPGMTAPQQMLQDGISTKKTLGHGLGAIKRLSDVFDIYSIPAWGTVILSRVMVKSAGNYRPPESITMEVLRVAKSGETACGDNWTLLTKGKQHRLAMIDGLGHGPEAEQAAVESVAAFAEIADRTPNEQLREIHKKIRKTRGAVMSIVHVDNINRQLTYCGVGNILTRLVNISLGAASRTFNTYNGIVGHTIPSTLNNTTMPWDAKLDMLILHSDGLSNRWDLTRYPNILQHHSMILCAALYKDYQRGTDDATVAVIRHPKKHSI